MQEEQATPTPNSDPLIVRLARLEDKPALTSLIELSVRELQRGDYSGPQLEAMLLHVYGVDTQLIEDGTYYVVEGNGQLVGAGGWSRRKTLFGGDQAKTASEDNLLDPTTDPAKIRAFFVHPAWARRGIGRLLMQTCQDAAEQAGFRRLELMATLTGERLYTASGFEVVERVELALADGLTAPLTRMAKELHPAAH